MLIKLINNNSIRKDLSTKITIKVISDFIKIIKIINNDLSLLKQLRKRLYLVINFVNSTIDYNIFNKRKRIRFKII